MINFIDYTDFADNETAIDLTQFNTTQFESIATKVIYDVLNDLFGAKLYNDLIADLDVDGKPQTQVYIDLVNGKTYIDVLRMNKTINFQGIKKMLRYFIYVEYKLFKLSFDTTSGTIQQLQEGVKVLDKTELSNILASYYNQAVFLYRKTVKFLNDNWYNSQLYFTNNEFSIWSPKPYYSMNKFETITIDTANKYQLPGGLMNYDQSGTILL